MGTSSWYKRLKALAFGALGVVAALVSILSFVADSPGDVWQWAYPDPLLIVLALMLLVTLVVAVVQRHEHQTQITDLETKHGDAIANLEMKQQIQIRDLQTKHQMETAELEERRETAAERVRKLADLNESLKTNLTTALHENQWLGARVEELESQPLQADVDLFKQFLSHTGNAHTSCAATSPTATTSPPPSPPPSMFWDASTSA